MDNLLEAMLKSEKPAELKRQFALKVKHSGQQPHSPQEVIDMLQLCSRILLHSPQSLDQDMCRQVYHNWARYNTNSLQEYFNSNTLHYLLDEQFRNGTQAIWLIHESMKLIPSNTSNFMHLCQIVQMKSINFVREHTHFEILTAFCELLNTFRQCIPKGDYASTLCISIINTVATFSSPAGLVQLKAYVRNVNIGIGGLLNHVWYSNPPDCVIACLRAIFNLISYEDERRQVEPSFALGGIVQYIPEQFIEEVTKTTVSNADISDRNMQTALTRMVGWLTWPYSKNVDKWIVSFFKGLSHVHKYTLMIDVIEDTVGDVFEKLQYPVVRDNAFRVLSHMLLSYQHSPEAFHKVAEKVPWLSKVLEMENCEASHQHRLRQAELWFCLMQLYPGYPDLYEPILDAFRGIQPPSPGTVKEKLAQHKWGASQDRRSSLTSSCRVWRKSETGKSGLFNLGNTCYMNSVIQALFMCDSFRQEVLQTVPEAGEGLLYQLQYLLALLSASQRAAISPIDFLTASRPPWFTTGYQQDCSEFLQYVLDQLNEQELHSAKKLASPRKQQSPNKDSSHHGFKSLFRSKHHNHQTGRDQPVSSMVQKTFGGQINRTTKCFKCLSESTHSERFTDMAMSFPESECVRKPGMALYGGSAHATRNKSSDDVNAPPQKPIILQDLIDYNLTRVKLEGDNQYRCDKCKSLQDAERSLKVVRAPQYLILTLSRFSYDPKTQSKWKIFADVKYPKTIHLPVYDESDASVQSKRSKSKDSPPGTLRSHHVTRSEPRLVKFGLVSVIVHSGLSSDGGHYYCYGRHSLVVTGASEQDSVDVDYLQDKWYLFNDSRVSYSSYSSFSAVTSKFDKDTAYVLFYKQITDSDLQGQTIDPNESIITAVADPPLRQNLREIVDSDNKQYLQEQEYAERSREVRRRQSGGGFHSTSWSNWNDDNDRGPPGCGGGGGMGGFNSGPPVVF